MRKNLQLTNFLYYFYIIFIYDNSSATPKKNYIKLYIFIYLLFIYLFK